MCRLVALKRQQNKCNDANIQGWISVYGFAPVLAAVSLRSQETFGPVSHQPTKAQKKKKTRQIGCVQDAPF